MYNHSHLIKMIKNDAKKVEIDFESRKESQVKASPIYNF